MAPYVPEEVDVFTVPHSRMKELVNDYFEKVERTNFCNALDLDGLLLLKMVQLTVRNDIEPRIVAVERTNFCNALDMEGLLKMLQNTFVEFKHHERIENKLIMKKLKNKLKAQSVRNSAVCNCHKDSHLTDMLRLVTDGYSKKTDQDRINYGLQLKEALEEFTQDFLPHMKQEEEVFQPLLLEYFSYEELCELKFKVIQQHLHQEKYKRDVLQRFLFFGNLQDSDSPSSDSTSESEEDDYCAETAKASAASRTTIIDLPQELMSQIFSHLNIRDLARSAQVCRSWSEQAYDPLLWKRVHPVKWALGDWDYHRDANIVPMEDEDDGASGSEDNYTVIDEDADVDESDSSDDALEDIQLLRREAHILVGLAKYVLPRVGSAVSILDLSRSRALTSSLLNKLLRQCPNVELLDITQTRVSDTGLKSLGRDFVGSKLKWLHLAGCVNISDATLMRLALALSQPEVVMVTNNDHSACLQACNVSLGQDSCLCEEVRNMEESLKQLKFENLTSCWYQENCSYGDKSGRKCDRLNGSPCKDRSRLKQEYCDKNGKLKIDTAETRICCSDPPADGSSCHAGCQPKSMETSIEECAGQRGKYGSSGGCCQISSDRGTSRAYLDKNRRVKKPEFIRTLKYLDLSGCYQITDQGLRALSGAGPLSQLWYLDLSGCAGVTAEGLASLVDVCPVLAATDLYYCDNIEDGPYADEANGCQNLGCGARFCCRTGT